MSDYGFVHADKVFTPDRSIVDLATNDERNKAIERAELDVWRDRPSTAIAYYVLPAGADARVNRFAELRDRPYEVFTGGETRELDARVTTWLGTTIGTITRARIYRHNFGGRFISLLVKGTNGASYAGRASYDWGTVVRLRRIK